MESEILESLKNEDNREKIIQELKKDIEELLKEEKDFEFDEKRLEKIKPFENEKIDREIIFLLNELFDKEVNKIKSNQKEKIEKFLLLKIYGNLLLNIDIGETFKEDFYYRGRLFKKDESPFCNEESYMELVQPPKDCAGKQRYSKEKQSRFYIMNKKIGTYFECRKYEETYKYHNLYVQKFKIKNKDLNIVKINGLKSFCKVPETINEISNEKIKENSFNSDYNVTNYVADIINASSERHGISYESAILYRENNNLYNNLKNIKYETYKNLVLFFDVWDKEKYLKKLCDEDAINDFKIFFNTGNKLEAKNYFEPELSPEKLEPKDVILEFFSKENMKMDTSYEKLKLDEKAKIDINIDFKRLFENLYKEIDKIKDIICLEYSYEEEEGFAENYYTNIFKEYLSKIVDIGEKTEIDFSEYEELKEEKCEGGKLISNYTIKIRKEKEEYIVEKVGFSDGFHKEVTEEFMSFFHYYFGIYYKIIIDYERDKIGLFEV